MNILGEVNTEIQDERTGGSEPLSKKQRTNIPRILDGTFYTICETTTDEKVDAKCTECLRIIKGNFRSTGNFLNHYRTKHSVSMKNVEEHINRTERTDRIQLTQTSVSVVAPATS